MTEPEANVGGTRTDEGPHADAAAALRRRLAGVGAVFAVLAGAAAFSLGTSWLLPTAVVGGYLLAYADRHREANRPPETDDLPARTLGAANCVTLLRGGLIAALSGFAVVAPPSAWLPAALFVTAALLDAVDGAVARRTRETVLGARLDGATDAATVAVGSVVAVVAGALPAWYLVAGGLWYAYSAVLYRRRRTGLPVYELPPSRLRPAVGIAQFGVVAVALVPGAAGLGLTAVAGVALLALLASFLRDGLAATGRLGRESPPLAES